MAKILVVEDERPVRRLLVDTISDEGYYVREAEDGEQALSKIYQEQPDLILLDVYMPGMDGFQVCEHLLRTSRCLCGEQRPNR